MGRLQKQGECLLASAVQGCHLQQRRLAHMYASCPAEERQARGPGPLASSFLLVLCCLEAGISSCGASPCMAGSPV